MDLLVAPQSCYHRLHNSPTSSHYPLLCKSKASLALSTINSSFHHPSSTVLTVKLDDKNYSPWRRMVLAVLKRQKGRWLGTWDKGITIQHLTPAEGASE